MRDSFDASRTTTFDAKAARDRLLRVLEKRVLQQADANIELQAYFRGIVFERFAASAEDGFSHLTDEDLENLALLFMHHDADSTGLLSRDQFFGVIRLLSASSGAGAFNDDRLDEIFREVHSRRERDQRHATTARMCSRARRVPRRRRRTLMAPTRSTSTSSCSGGRTSV